MRRQGERREADHASAFCMRSDWRRSLSAAPAVLTALSSSDRARPTPARSISSWRQRVRPSLSRQASCSAGPGDGDWISPILSCRFRQQARASQETCTLPSSPPGNPEHDFVILRADRMDLAQAKANFDARIKRTPGRRVLIFVHGFNTRFEEAVYRFAQIVHDARVNVAPGAVHLALRRQCDRLRL